MKNFNFKKTFVQGFAFALILASQAFAEKFIGTSCDGTCTFEYDSETEIMTFSGTGVIKSNFSDTIRWWDIPNRVIKNVVIGEGIIGAEGHSFSSSWHTAIGASDGYIKIPSTFTNAGVYDNQNTFYYAGFGTYEISPTNFTTISHLGISMPNAHTLILTADENFSLTQAQPSKWPASIDVQCKGDKKICEKMVNKMNAQNNFSYSYYSGLDGNGNWEVWSDDGKAVYEDSSETKPLAKYDFDGNQTGLYQYDSGGNLIKAIENGNITYRRRIYTISEATSAVQNNKNKNTFSIIYR